MYRFGRHGRGVGVINLPAEMQIFLLVYKKKRKKSSDAQFSNNLGTTVCKMAHAYVCADVERLALDCCHRNDNSCLGRQLKPCPTQPAPNFSLAVLSHPATRYYLVSLFHWWFE